MASFTDRLFGDAHVTTGIAAAALALSLPLLFPKLRAPMLAILRAGATLFVEAEFEVEEDAIAELVDATVEGLVTALAGPAPAADRHQAAEAVLGRFTHKARRRSERWARDDGDRATRYRRHVGALKRRMARLAAEGPEQHRSAIARLTDEIAEDW